MTRVGVDVSAIPADPRGAGKYVVELVRALGTRARVELAIESRRGDGERWESLAPQARVHPVVPDSRFLRLAWEQIGAPRVVDRWGIDVFHGPHYTMPEIAKTPKLVTIHDLTFFDHPEWHEKVKVSFFTRAIKVAVRRADGLICVSDATARRLRELFDRLPAVHVVPHGIDHDLFRPDDPTGEDAAHLAALGIPDGRRYIAFVATLEPRKDVITLVRAFDRIAARDDDVLLVIGGGTGWGAAPLERALAASPHQARIMRTGYLAPAAVPALMRHAAVFVYAAFEEGFGLPVIESLACGAPTVTTEASVMDELAGGAALTTKAGDVDALASVLTTLLDNGRDEARAAAGVAVARRFTWEATAEGHERIYATFGA